MVPLATGLPPSSMSISTEFRKTPVAINDRAGGRLLEGRRTLILRLTLATLTIAWFAFLGERALYDPDEGRYAEIPREMLQGTDWLTPHLNDLVYLEKPPLQYWMTAISFRLFGESETAARLATGIAGYLSLVIVFLLGRRLWGNAAGVEAVFLTGASALFVLLAHQLTLDMLLSFWLLACLACFLLAQLNAHRDRRCRHWMLGSWTAMALAVLTKGLVAVLLPAATLILYALWQRDRDVLRRLYIRWGLPVFLVIAVPWFALAARANRGFIHFFFVREHLQRFLTPIEHRSEPGWFFMAVMGVGILPWLPQALAALARTWRLGEPRGQFDPVRVLWVWIVFTFLFFSLSDSKLIPYVLPIVAPLALLCASRRIQDNRVSVVIGSMLSLIAGIALIAYADGAWQSRKHLNLAPSMQGGLAVTAALLCGASVVSLALAMRDGNSTRAQRTLCVGWLFTSFAVLVAGAQVQTLFSARDLAAQLRLMVTAETPIYSVQMYDQSLAFYLQRPVTLVDYRDEFAFGLDRTPQLGIADLQQFSDRWRDLDEGYAVMRVGTEDLLRRQGLPMREIASFANRVVMSRR
jgi:4-amino-4-deoxy-L-arabinose transferase-like glycosyltransferase